MRYTKFKLKFYLLRYILQDLYRPDRIRHLCSRSDSEVDYILAKKYRRISPIAVILIVPITTRIKIS